MLRNQVSFKPMSSFIKQSNLSDVSDLISQNALNNNIMVDVGAAIGIVTECMIRSNPSCTVYAFEPYEFNFHALQEKFGSSPQAKLFKLALSNHSKTMNFNIPSVKKKDVDDNKAVPIGYSGAGYLIPASSPLCKSENTTIVQCGRLDDFVTQAVDIMKIDVQGHEWAVLEGAAGLLNNSHIKHIWFEFMGDHRVIDILLAHNYSIFETVYYKTTSDISLLPSCFDLISATRNYNGTVVSILKRTPNEQMSMPQYVKWFTDMRAQMCSLWTDLYAAPIAVLHN